MRDDVTVATASTVRLDAVLELGALSEKVEVKADVAQIQTESAKVSTAVQNRLVDELPLVVGGALRSPYDLATLVPEARGFGTQGLALGGGQAAAWNATIDGLTVTNNRMTDLSEISYITPSVEAITEFTVDTNGFKAEYGQAGGGVMTFSSKSGTNDVHGVAYDFLRNDDLDARGFFARTRSVYKQNDFGVTLGGPVYLPKVYNGKNRTFFFLSYEGFRNRVGSNGSIFSVPTPEMYQGDFSKWVNSAGSLLQIYDPFTTRVNASGSSVRDPFPNNQVPLSRFSSLASQVITYAQGLKPNRGGVPGTVGYVQQNYISSSGSVVSPTDKGSVKIDHIIHNDHRLGFLFNITRYLQAPGSEVPPGLPEPLWDGVVTSYNTEVYRLAYDWTISPRMLNNFSIGRNHFFKNQYSPNAGQNWKSKLCMKNVVDCNENFPQVTFTEFQEWGGVSYNGTEHSSVSLKDDLNYIRGKHSLKFGYAYQRQRADGTGEQNISGLSGYSFLGTSVPGATSFTSGSSFASFLLGWAQSAATQEGQTAAAQIYPYQGLYAQDDWHLTSRLTLNLGVRWELIPPPYNVFDMYSDFTPDRPNPAVNNYPGALRFAGYGPGRENTRSLVPGWYGGIGPRIGLAYSPDGKTTFRLGWGRSFSKVTTPWGGTHAAGFKAFPSWSSPDQGITPAILLDNGLPPYVRSPFIDPTFSNNTSVDWWQGQEATRAPENLNWTLSVQRQLTPNTLIEAAYDANVGTHLMAGLVNTNQTPTSYLNQFIQQYGATGALNLLRADITSSLARTAGIRIPYPNFTDPTVQTYRTVAQALRPYPQYQSVSTGGSSAGDHSGHSTYHGLMIKAQRRLSSGLIFQWNYVLSKLLTDADSMIAGGGTEDQYNRRLEKSIGQFDQTHLLKLNTLYELPIGKGKKLLSSGGVASRLLGGWQIAAIQSYGGGFPLTLTRNNPLPINNSSTRPLITSYTGWRAPIAGSKFDPNVDKFLNIAAFPAQPTAGFGNATRYNPKLRSWPLFNENVSLAKSFNITENKRIDFRWEAFNLFNRTQFGNPSANLNSSTFGVISSQANTPRQMQGALKLYW